MSVLLSRRALLGAFAVATAACTVGPFDARRAMAAPVIPDGDVFDQLRLRYRETLVGPPNLDLTDPIIAQEALNLAAEADILVGQLDRSEIRLGVFADLPLLGATDSGVITDTFKRLVTLATAWAVPGQPWSGSNALAADLVGGLQTMHDLAYHQSAPEWDNWWDWELGSPQRIGKILTIAYDIVPETLRTNYVAAVTHFVAHPGFMYPADSPKHKPATGSNLLNICLGAANVAIVGKQADRLALVSASAPQGLGFNNGSTLTLDGLHPDGSYIQHDDVAYAGSYGVSFLRAVGDIVMLLGGSEWAISSPGMNDVFDSVDRAFLPMIFDGVMLDFVSGREVSYSDRNDATRGRLAVLTIIDLSVGVDAARQARWLAAAKGWIERSAFIDLSKPSSISAVPSLNRALEPSVIATEEPEEVVVFPLMDRAVHRRTGWAVSLTVSSERIARFEVTNSENRRPWHQGSGQLAVYLAGDTEGQRSDAYWPTVDPFRLPGTTVDSTPLPDITETSLSPSGFGSTVFSTVGGPLNDAGRQRGSYGTAFSQERGYDSTMELNQSWFFTDDGVICLGAGIRGGNAAVETIVENHRVRLDSTEKWSVDGRKQPGSTTPGFHAVFARPKYAVLDGAAGYVFLQRPDTFRVRRENREGTWERIKINESTDPLTRGYSTAWIDHGAQPANASYAYVLLPGADSRTTERFAKDPGVKVLSNTLNVQAVRLNNGYIGANFATAGAVTQSGVQIAVTAPSSVSVLSSRGKSKSVEIALADLTRSADSIEARFELPTGHKWRVDHADATVSASVARKELVIRVSPGGTGNSHRVRVVPA